MNKLLKIISCSLRETLRNFHADCVFLRLGKYVIMRFVVFHTYLGKRIENFPAFGKHQLYDPGAQLSVPILQDIKRLMLCMASVLAHYVPFYVCVGIHIIDKLSAKEFKRYYFCFLFLYHGYIAVADLSGLDLLPRISWMASRLPAAIVA